MAYIILLSFTLLAILSIKRTLKYFIIFIILTPPALLLIQSPNLPLLSVSNAMMIILFILIIILHFQNKLEFFYSDYKNFLGFIFLYIAYIFVILYSNQPLVGFITATMNLFAVFFPAFLYVKFYKTNLPQDHIKMLHIVSITLLLLGLYATLSLLIGDNIYANIMDSSLQTDLVKVNRYTDDIRGERAIGTLSHPITYGAFIAIGMFSFLFLAAYNQVICKRSMKTYFYLSLFVLMFFFLLLSNSRTPLLFIFTGFFLLFFYLDFKTKLWMLLISLVLIIVFGNLIL